MLAVYVKELYVTHRWGFRVSQSDFSVVGKNRGRNWRKGDVMLGWFRISYWEGIVVETFLACLGAGGARKCHKCPAQGRGAKWCERSFRKGTCDEMVQSRWNDEIENDNSATQKLFQDPYSLHVCHNVSGYISDKKENELVDQSILPVARLHG